MRCAVFAVSKNHAPLIALKRLKVVRQYCRLCSITPRLLLFSLFFYPFSYVSQLKTPPRATLPCTVPFTIHPCDISLLGRKLRRRTLISWQRTPSGTHGTGITRTTFPSSFIIMCRRRQTNGHQSVTCDFRSNLMHSFMGAFAFQRVIGGCSNLNFGT